MNKSRPFIYFRVVYAIILILVSLLVLIACGEEGNDAGSEQDTTTDFNPTPPSVLPPVSASCVSETNIETRSADGPRYDLIIKDWNSGPVLLLVNSETGACEELVRLSGGIDWAGQVAISPTGEHIAYVTWESYEEQLFGSWQLYVIRLSDRQKTHIATLQGGGGGQANWHPDATKLAYVSFDYSVSNWAVYSADMQGNSRQVAVAGGRVECIQPDWSPSGDRLIFTGWQGSGRVLYSADMSSGLVSVLYASQEMCDVRWSHSGSWLVAKNWNEAIGNWEIVRLSPDGASVDALVQLKANEPQAQWSPDDSEIAFVDYNYEISAAELYTVQVDTLSVTALAPLNTGISAGQPQWSIDGSRLVYTIYDYDVFRARVMVVNRNSGSINSVKVLGTGISAGKPQWLRVSTDRKIPEDDVD